MLTAGPAHFPEVSVLNEDVYEQSMPALQYAVYTLENQRTEQPEFSLTAQSCWNMMEGAVAGTIRPFHNLFLHQQGEMVQLLSCLKKSWRVEPQNYCTEGVL